MDDKIIDAAREAGFANQYPTAPMLQMLAHFYAIAYRQGMERAAEICETEWSNTAEKLYGQDCAAAIRAEAHALNQPKNAHDGSVV